MRALPGVRKGAAKGAGKEEATKAIEEKDVSEVPKAGSPTDTADSSGLRNRGE